MDMSIGSGIAVAGVMIALAVTFVGKLLADVLATAADRYTAAMLRQADVFDASARRSGSRRGES